MVGRLILESGPVEQTEGAGGQSMEIDLDVLGRPFHARISVPPVPIRLADVVPVARQLSSALTAFTLDQLRQQGVQPPCTKGCAACCRVLAPVSAAEALCLWEEVTALPRPERMHLLAANVQAARRVLQADPPDLSRQDADQAEPQPAQSMTEMARWYAGLDLDCPFLKDNACTVYEIRPMACREFFAHCPEAQPAGADLSGVDVVRLPYPVASALSQLGREFEPSWPQVIALPLALMWARDGSNRTDPQTWPAPVLFARLVRIIRKQASLADQQTQAA